MSKFDREKDIIKNLEFDPNCNGGSYTNEDRNTIYKSSLYSDGTGKKDDKRHRHGEQTCSCHGGEGLWWGFGVSRGQ